METWLRLFRSENPGIRIRAAQGLLEHGSEIPLPILLEIFDDLHASGLGAKTERVLLERRDPELVSELLARLHSDSNFVREVACTVLGRQGDFRATPHLLRMLDDPMMMVRRAAGFALASLRDKSCATELLRRYEKARHDDVNVRMAIECALREIGCGR